MTIELRPYEEVRAAIAADEAATVRANAEAAATRAKIEAASDEAVRAAKHDRRVEIMRRAKAGGRAEAAREVLARDPEGKLSADNVMMLISDMRSDAERAGADKRRVWSESIMNLSEAKCRPVAAARLMELCASNPERCPPDYARKVLSGLPVEGDDAIFATTEGRAAHVTATAELQRKDNRLAEIRMAGVGYRASQGDDAAKALARRWRDAARLAEFSGKGLAVEARAIGLKF